MILETTQSDSARSPETPPPTPAQRDADVSIPAQPSKKSIKAERCSKIEPVNEMVENPEERSAFDILRLIKSQELDPKTLKPDDRRTCVLHLLGEGLSTSEIAHVLRCHDRTIERDRREIRESNSLRVDPGFADRVAGELMSEGDMTISRIRRAARDAAAAPGDRIAAEKSCFDIRCQLIDRLQSLGYLPNAARRTELSFRADGNALSNLDLSQEINQMVLVVQQDPNLADFASQLRALETMSNQGLVTERIANLKERLMSTEAPSGGGTCVVDTSAESPPNITAASPSTSPAHG
jgi:hypothetical protein